jgi:ApaG protein
MSSRAITYGVEIKVETFYQPEYSNPLLHEFMFAYRIVITNHNPFSVQLLNRHWYIFDSNAEYREVEGDGVIGQQPILLTDEDFQYVSGCQLHTELGTMHGSYQMLNLHTNKTFEVEIPKFMLQCPSICN